MILGICLALILLMKSFVLFALNSDVLNGENNLSRYFANCRNNIIRLNCMPESVYLRNSKRGMGKVFFVRQEN